MDEHEVASEKQGLPLDQVVARARQNAPVLAMAIGAGGAVALFVVALVASWPLWVAVVLGCLVVLLVAAVGGLLRAATAWDNPQLFLPSNEDLHLGDHVVVRFRREARSSIDTTDAEVRAVVIVEERCRVSGARDPRRRVHEQPVAVVMHAVVDNTVEADLALDVPLYDAPPTMDLGGHEVMWFLEVTIDAPHAPNDTSTFPLVVAPEVARRLVDGGAGR